MSTWSDSTNTVAAVASAVATAAACFVAVRGNRAADRSNAAADTANEAAASANRTAEAVARIEQARWQDEMEPTFDISIARLQGGHGTLDVQLTGPHALRQLDEIVIDVLASDDMLRDPLNPLGRPTAEDIRNQTWGPYRFTPRTDGADEHGKRMAPFALQVGRGHPFAIEETRPPLWQEGNDRAERWREQWDGKPIRLRITCRREGREAWVIPYDVERPPAPFVA